MTERGNEREHANVEQAYQAPSASSPAKESTRPGEWFRRLLGGGLIALGLGLLALFVVAATQSSESFSERPFLWLISLLVIVLFGARGVQMLTSRRSQPEDEGAIRNLVRKKAREVTERAVVDKAKPAGPRFCNGCRKWVHNAALTHCPHCELEL